MSFDAFNFDRFEILYIVNGVIRNLSILHVGASSAEKLGEIDNPVLRVNIIREGKVMSVPVIPGSTLKGVFRSYFERVARSLGEHVCDIFSEKSEEELNKPCIACRVFGNQKLASHVYFFDVLPIEISNFSLYTTRSGVSIDRFFGASRAKYLRKDEYVVPGIDWSFEMRVFNLDLDSDMREASIFREVLKIFVDTGLQFGGRKSIGSGLFRFVNGNVKKYVLVNGELKNVMDKSLSKWLNIKENGS